MNKLEQLIIRVLQNKVKYNDIIVPVLLRPPVESTVPAITVDNSPGAVTVDKYFTHNEKERLVSKVSAQVNLHLWCDNLRELDIITDKVLDCFHRMETNHYTYCARYDDGKCETLNADCAAINSTTGKGFKHQCPCPSEYDYQNQFDNYDIVASTFNIESPFRLDDLNTRQPLFRNVFKINGVFYDYYTVGGKVSTTLEF